jgi:hypothetical protein
MKLSEVVLGQYLPSDYICLLRRSVAARGDVYVPVELSKLQSAHALLDWLTENTTGLWDIMLAEETESPWTIVFAVFFAEANEALLFKLHWG